MTRNPRSFAFLVAVLAPSFGCCAADAPNGSSRSAPKPAATVAVVSPVAQAAAKRPLALRSASRQSAVIIHGVQY